MSATRSPGVAGKDGRWLAPSLALAFALLYGCGRTHSHTFDALLCARAIRDGAWTDALHPQHLLYGVILKSIWKLLLLSGLNVDPLGGAALVNAAAAGAAVAVFALWLRESGAPLRWSLAGAVGLGLSSCFWMLASENESYAGAVLLMLLATRATGRHIRSGRGAPGTSAALWLAGATLLHAAALLLLLPLSLFGSPSPRSARVRAALRGLLVAVVPIALAYALALAWRGEATLAAGSAWMNRYMRWDSWRPGNPLRLFEGGLWMARAVAPDFGLIGAAPHPFAGAAANFLVRVPFLLTCVALVWIAVSLWRRGKISEAAGGALLRLCLLWLLFYGALLGWIGRSSLKFWSLTLPPLWALGVMAASGMHSARASAGRNVRLLTLGLFVVLLAALNGLLVIAPRHDPKRDVAHASADEIMRVARPGDLILAPSGDLEACLRYYHPELGVATLESLARKSRSMSATLGKLEADAARVRASGGRAWCLGTGLVVTREVSELWNQAPDGMAALRAWKGSLQVRAAYGDTTSTMGPEGPLGQPVMLEWFAETGSPR